MSKGSALDATGLVRALRAAQLHDAPRDRLLALACERIRAWGSPFTSVYAYMLHGDELVLDAYAGRETEHTRIPWGKACAVRRSLPEKTRTSRTWRR